MLPAYTEAPMLGKLHCVTYHNLSCRGTRPVGEVRYALSEETFVTSMGLHDESAVQSSLKILYHNHLFR